MIRVAPLLLASVALAAPRHWALAVGENQGLNDDPPLKFAQRDARQVLEVLTELGEVAREDGVLVDGANVETARAALTALEQRLAAQATREDVLWVYFSAHADDGALHLNGGRLPMPELMTFLERAPVAVAVLVVDSCRSGALTRLKGLKPVEGRRVDVVSGALEGRVVITSSGVDEYSQESDLIGGSYFTHHLLGGLRGPADASGDGQVTLEEAYHWAYARTVESTFATQGGVQKPEVRVDLRGYGALVLTRPVKSSASLLLNAPEPGEWLIASADPNGPVSLVQKPAGPSAVALPPGRYAVRLRTDDGYRERNLELRADTRATVSSDEMASGALIRVALKGPSAQARLTATVGGAIASGILSGLAYAAGAEARLQSTRLLPGVLQMALGFRVSQGEIFSQFEFEGRLSWMWRLSVWRIAFGLGPDLGLMTVFQDNLPGKARRIQVAPFFGAAAEARLTLTRALSLTLGLGGGAAVVRKELTGTNAVPRASAFLGLSFDVW